MSYVKNSKNSAKNRKKSQLVDFQHDKNGKKLGKLEFF
jgi:hypothetical protein